ncbi:hypothetical protein K435DRAFT_813962 [Dendrothele bispora CBS 962.96]|uniref:Fungal-type protein kinase domain-containing protein n=1 Tax=Dendrothele bispora (strain CBS 962.96) TaxID=1314807 RepID=A0A4S8KK85_DENBC|nr:hypothetical protein K435DRAFT_813962 [Dendrothele bispora CBS 962.96]
MRLNELLSNEPQDVLTLEQANALFRSSDSEYAKELEIISLAAASTSPPPLNGTEDSYHMFWDDNIRKVVQIIVPSGKAIWNSNKHTATGILRPDFGFILDDHCPFRGEEKGPLNDEDPRAELSQKLRWDYGSVPYVLGYYCSGTRLTYVAILRPEQANREPQIQDLGTVDLSTRVGRIANMRWLINLSPLLQDLVDLMP